MCAVSGVWKGTGGVLERGRERCVGEVSRVNGREIDPRFKV